MVALRPGSAEAIEFLARSRAIDYENVDEWTIALQNYPSVLKAVAAKKKNKEELLDLDKELRGKTFCAKVLGRDGGPYLTSEELSKIMKYKLNRGKMRPLQALCDSNSAQHVEVVSRKAFAAASKGPKHTREAVMELSKLRAVGPATASLILSLFYPHISFMADEALDCLVERDYTIEHCMMLQEATSLIAAALNKSSLRMRADHQKSWTDADICEVLYTIALGNVHGIPTLTPVTQTQKLKATSSPTSKKVAAAHIGSGITKGDSRKRSIAAASTASASKSKKVEDSPNEKESGK